MRWGIVYPILRRINIELNKSFPELVKPDVMKLQISDFNFFLIVLSTILIAAAGYIINDYFDVKLDRINKPNALLIDKAIKRRFAMASHIVLNVAGILLGTYVSYKIGLWKLSVIFPLCASALWFYSTNFKRQLITGNLLIAFLTALVPLIAGGTDVALIVQKYYFINGKFGINFNNISYFILGFAFFAFIVTLIREIIKDIEDSEGDTAYGCNTIPIAWGITSAKNIALGISVITFLCIAYLQYSQYKLHATSSFLYLLFFIQLPLLFIMYKINVAKNPKDFTIPARLVKVLMLFGILYAVVIYASFLNS